MEKRIEKLLRENEKLTSENRKNKKLAGYNSNNLSALGGGGNYGGYAMNTSKFDRSLMRGDQ